MARMSRLGGSPHSSLAIVGAIVIMLTQAAPARATNNCMQNEYDLRTGTTKTLTCTANDVRIAFARNPRDLNGNPLTSCNAGQTFSFIADFVVVTTATARENIGLYFAIAGQKAALTGTCADNIISPVHPPNCSTAAGQSPQCLGTSQYEELDPSSDNCGDISTDDNNQVVTVEVDNVLCKAAPDSNQLILPNCTSWQQPGGTLLCQSPAPDYPYVSAAIPGSPSKCNCDSGFTVPITVQNPTIAVSKTPNPSSITDAGGPVNYTVAVTNTSNFGGVTINQICDDKYGNIATAAGAKATCPAGSLCAAPNNVAGTTCATNVSCALPAALSSPQSSLTCTFTGNLPEIPSLTDTVTVNGVAQDGTTPISGTASATVTVGEAPATAADVVTSASAAPSYGCADVKYNVEVENTSRSAGDESETLSALNDSYYGDITKVQGNVLGTTCGVATNAAGLGVLSGASGAGVLPATIAVGGNYSCQFVGKFCGSAGALQNPPNATNCPAGIEVIDTVSGTLTGDDSEAVTQQVATLTVDVCFAATETTK